ncbi:Hypothetical protein AAM4_0561 [Actinomyces succiniciruminis]|uniref:Uncharacterized protein n=2 Tax=Actinomyces succiniciruminis TaxID=1522002 RepID=A0A1L7RGC9_9ACTO|nr:Hypothetical protein AAM4_0561 [Actinomyces succiniciruminis]
MLRAEVLDLLMLRPGDVEAAGDEELWPWLVRRAVWAVGDAAVMEELHGLAGDSNAHRLARRAADDGVVVGALEDADDRAVERAQRIAPAGDGAAPAAVEVGPVLGLLVEVLVGAGVPARVASDGTVRVAELAVSGPVRARHTRAREDARDGELGRLGVDEAAAGAWMALVVGSKRAGVDSSLVLALRSGRADVAGGGWSDLQRGWVARVAAGVHAVPTESEGPAVVPGGLQLELELALAAEAVMARVA